MIKKKGFTLVELLAVIVILAIILVIAVPQIMDTIDSARKASLESSAKMIAAQVENQHTVSQTLGTNFASSGDCTTAKWAGLNDKDYESCTYSIDSNGEAKVTLVGKGKFEGKYVCDGTRTLSTATEEECSGGSGGIEEPVSFSGDSWETIVAAVNQAYENETDYPYQIGETKTIDLGTTLGTHTIRVANTTKCSEVTVTSKTACGFVLEFADLIEKAIMNNGNTNAGGWPASKMRTYVNSTIYNALPSELKKGIINTDVISSHGKEDTTGELENDNFGSTDKLYLLSSQEVYGTSFTENTDTSNGTSRQLDYYEDNSVTISSNYDVAIKNDSSGTASSWWLRSAYSASRSSFYIVGDNGYDTDGTPHYSYGLAPAFRLAD